MYLSIATTHAPASDLGHLLHKHPDRVQSFDLSFGQAHVFYPQADASRCTAVLLLDVDPVEIVRRRPQTGGDGFALRQYINDRPYVTSSFLSVAIARVWGTALRGQCKDRPELVDVALPLQARLAAVPCQGGEALLGQLFEPLGYHLTARPHLLDEHFPEWGQSDYFTVELEHQVRLRDLLAHLYVLLPVLDDDKHYWVGEDEVAKLIRYGEGWLSHHPQQELIASRYLKHQRHLTRDALAQLAEEDNPDPDAASVRRDEQEVGAERELGLSEQRLLAVLAALRDSGAARVLDLGCGEGRLLELLLQDKRFSEVVGMDVSYRSLTTAAARLRLEQMPETVRQRVKLLQSSLVYRDKRLAGYDAAVVMEVVEHLEPFRLDTFERVLFETMRPTTVLLTTPNREYNVRWPRLAAGQFRHPDHRFEWTRAEFQEWGRRVAARFCYRVRFGPVGEEDAVVGAPTQMGVFER